MADTGTQAAGGPAAASAPSGRRRPLWLWVAGLGCGLLTLLWLAGAGALLLFFLRGPARHQCYEIVVAFPSRDAEEVDRQVGTLLAGTDPSMVHRTVAEDGRLTVYARSDQVAAFVRDALGRPPLADSGASIQGVGQLPEVPPKPELLFTARLRIVLDRASLCAMGLSVDEVNRQLGPRLDKAGPDDAESIRKLEVKGPNGQAFRLAEFATLEVVNSPSNVVRDYPEDAPAVPSGDPTGR